jgi:hypothetical protein
MTIYLIFELIIFISESIKFYIFYRFEHISEFLTCEASQEKPEPQAAARGHEAEGRKSVVTRCSERIPRQQVQTCDLL